MKTLKETKWGMRRGDGEKDKEDEEKEKEEREAGEGMVDGKVGRGKEGNEENVNVRNGEDQL